MKCPRCDADISTQNKCRKCGFIADNRDVLEVKYTDFKTSELLEIRHKKQATSSVAEREIFMEQPGVDVIERDKLADTLLEDKKSSFPILTFVVLILALIIGLFLVRLLVLQKYNVSL